MKKKRSRGKVSSAINWTTLFFIHKQRLGTTPAGKPVLLENPEVIKKHGGHAKPSHGRKGQPVNSPREGIGAGRRGEKKLLMPFKKGRKKLNRKTAGARLNPGKEDDIISSTQEKGLAKKRGELNTNSKRRKKK